MKKILLIEDDVDTIDMVEFVLQEAGYAVIKINRQISIKEIAGINPHLIVLDFFLPIRLGSELCLELKNNDCTKHIPVILYSASRNIEQVAKDCGAEAFMEKPFDIYVLAEKVRELAL